MRFSTVAAALFAVAAHAAPARHHHSSGWSCGAPQDEDPPVSSVDPSKGPSVPQISPSAVAVPSPAPSTSDKSPSHDGSSPGNINPSQGGHGKGPSSSSSPPAGSSPSTGSSKPSSSAPASALSSPAATPSSSPSTNTGGLWQPAVGDPFQIVLNSVPDAGVSVVPPVKIFDIDLFGASAEVVSGLHAQGIKVICYLSGGSSESWRPDYNQFTSSDKGNPLSGWPGENWLDVRSTNVRRIMAARIQQAKDKGCDAIDPDNVDGYGNDNGLGLSKQDAVDFVIFLADTAAGLGISIGLKNAQEILPSVASKVQFAVNESCAANNECQLYDDFLNTKPVFHIEYVDEQTKKRDLRHRAVALASHCDPKSAPNLGSKMSTVVKLYSLNGFVQYCDGNSFTTIVTK